MEGSISINICISVKVLFSYREKKMCQVQITI